jgi:hypothetical protein
MKAIPLTKGFATVIDDEDYDRLVKYPWCITINGTCAYAFNNCVGYMHRFILGAQQGQFVDHINFDSLDNRRENLRFCTKAQNQQHQRRRRNNSSGYRGVSWNKQRSKYRVRIHVSGREILLGHFGELEQAAAAYRDAASRLHKEFKS